MSAASTNNTPEAKETPTPAAWIVGSVDTAAGPVPRVEVRLRPADRLGAWKARWGIGRMQYRVEPGLYAVGEPSPDAPVLVSANYKMSFDRLRSQLAGLDVWIVVLDTKGINVWCAAGKGTFGTDELVRQIEDTKPAQVVSHRKLIVPQLGAPGVAAHEVRQRTGFRVRYGPVRAEDLPEFVRAGMKATGEMRRVRFPLRDRLAVAPVELVMSAKYVLAIAAGFLLLAGLGADGYSWQRVAGVGTWSAVLFVAVCVAATVLTPALLPWLPGRALAVKGFWLGLAFVAALGVWTEWGRATDQDPLGMAAWCLVIPAATSFLAMNFTGATTYTSLSGVRLEVRTAGPVQAVCGLVGATLWIITRFV